MVSRKTPAENYSLKNESELDRHLELAFKRILKIAKQLLTDLEKEPDIKIENGIRSYSKTLKGFIQSDVSKKRGLNVDVNLYAQFDKG